MTDDPKQPAALWCRDGERAEFDRESSLCKLCRWPAWWHWTVRPVAVEGGR